MKTLRAAYMVTYIVSAVVSFVALGFVAWQHRDELR